MNYAALRRCRTPSTVLQASGGASVGPAPVFQVVPVEPIKQLAELNGEPVKMKGKILHWAAQGFADRNAHWQHSSNAKRMTGAPPKGGADGLVQYLADAGSRYK